MSVTFTSACNVNDHSYNWGRVRGALPQGTERERAQSHNGEQVRRRKNGVLFALLALGAKKPCELWHSQCLFYHPHFAQKFHLKQDMRQNGIVWELFWLKQNG